MNYPFTAMCGSERVTVYDTKITSNDRVIALIVRESGVCGVVPWSHLVMEKATAPAPEPEPEPGPEPWGAWQDEDAHTFRRYRRHGTESQVAQRDSLSPYGFRWSWFDESGFVAGGRGFQTPDEARAACEEFTSGREGVPRG